MNPSVARILDANGNRAREALRVMEDYARFVVNDRELAGGVKTLRHDLAGVFGRFEGAGLCRDTPGDVGTGLSTAGEMRRGSLGDVVVAAGKRLSEALRSLEEFAKTLDGEAARGLEQLRYRGYALEGVLLRIVGAGGSAERFAGVRLCVLLTEGLCYPGVGWEGMLDLILGAARGGTENGGTLLSEGTTCPAGRETSETESESLAPRRAWHPSSDEPVASDAEQADLVGTCFSGEYTVKAWHPAQTVKASLCVQLREKGLEDGELLRRAKILVGKCRAAGAVSIINDRVDVAMLAGADGVHLGQTDLGCAEVRKLAGPDLIVGVSTENLEQARRAVREGASYVAVGPMFATRTKEKPRLAGPGYAREAVGEIPLPVIAIGGITRENVGELTAAGVGAVAVCAAVIGVGDAAGAVRGFLECIGGRE